MASGTAGYSSTPLVKKLGIEDGHDLLLISAPSGWQVPGLQPGVAVRRLSRVVPGRDFEADVVIAFFRSARELSVSGPLIAGRLGPTAPLWAAWPRRAGGHRSDITDNLIRDVLLPVGIVDVKVAALDQDWSGLKFVRRASGRPQAT